MGTRGEIFSVRSNSKSENRTYFFNVKENRGGDIFLNIVESKKHMETDFQRHQIVIFEEDIPEFLAALETAVTAIKTGVQKRPPMRPRTAENSSGGFRRDQDAR